LREEDEGCGTEKGQRQGESDHLKWQGEVDYISGGTSYYSTDIKQRHKPASPLPI
jgi:hypothetical protein